MTETKVAAAEGKRSRAHPPAAADGKRAGRRHLGPLGLPWILPALILSAGLIYYGIGYTGYVSTLRWNGTSLHPRHIGAQNYVQVLHDPVFWRAVEHTVVYFIVTFVVQTTVGVLLAVFLHSKVRLAVVYKILIFIPVILAPAIMAPVFRQMYSANGQFNWLLSHIGLGSVAQPWLAQSSTALAVIIAITIWHHTGVTFVLYFAAMGQIEPEVLEAARIDGAGNVRTLTSIIWPGVRGTTVALAMLSVIGALKTFDIPYLVTIGGPNYATEFLGTFIYRAAIAESKVGYAATLSIFLLVLALGMAILMQYRAREKGPTV
jgi:raffinose/stachyose/melibiose transport system permease protein